MSAATDYGGLFVAGDEWGLVEVVPAENRPHYAEVARRLAEHHKDTEFGPHGWTTPPFLLPAPAVPLSVRAIPPEVLTDAFAGILTPTDRVTTCVDTTGPPYPAQGERAWKIPGTSPFAAGFYGGIAEGVLAALSRADRPVDPTTADLIARALAPIGERYRLLLVAHGRLLFDLEDRARVAEYLAGGEPTGERPDPEAADG